VCIDTRILYIPHPAIVRGGLNQSCAQRLANPEFEDLCCLLSEHLLIILELGEEQTVALLERDSVPGVLVVGREARRVGRLGDLAVGHLLEGVVALALGVQSVHEMHLEDRRDLVVWVDREICWLLPDWR